MSREIKRWKIKPTPESADTYFEYVESPDGEWVRYDDISWAFGKTFDEPQPQAQSEPDLDTIRRRLGVADPSPSEQTCDECGLKIHNAVCWTPDCANYGRKVESEPSEQPTMTNTGWPYEKTLHEQIAKLTAEKQEALTNYWEVLEQFQQSSSRAHQLKAQVDEYEKSMYKAAAELPTTHEAWEMLTKALAKYQKGE